MPYASNSRRDEIRRAVAARERAEARISSITTTVAVASVVTAGAGFLRIGRLQPEPAPDCGLRRCPGHLGWLVTHTDLPRLLPARPEDLRGHLARFGSVPYRGTASALIPDVEESG